MHHSESKSLSLFYFGTQNSLGVPGGSLGIPGGSLVVPWGSLGVPGGSLGSPLENHEKLEVLYREKGQKCRAGAQNRASRNS